MGTALTTGAFLTHSTDKLMNRIIPGTVAADLNEPDWNPENGIHMLPGSAALKNPVGENTGTLPVWMFMEVGIPVRRIVTVDPETKRKKTAEEVELFSFQEEEQWELISKKMEGENMIYIFGYQKIVEPLEKTEPLFTAIKIVPYLEGELNPEETFDVPVNLHAVQSNICEPGKTMEEIYHIYLENKKEGENA